MTPFAIDRDGDVPLHAQIAQWLRNDIRDRGLDPGTVLPSEAQLGERFGVARSVVRQALANLVNEGAILRHPGRAPTVAPAREHHRLVQRSTGMFDQFAKTGVKLRTRVLALGPQKAPATVAAFFGSNDLILLERVRYVDDAPLALVHTWLPTSLGALLDVADLTDASLHGLLQSRAHVRPGKGRNHIKAVAATAAHAAQLGVAPGSPLLLLEGLGRDQDDRPMEYFFTWHRSEHLVFDVDVTDDDEKISRRLATSAGAGEADIAGAESDETRAASTDFDRTGVPSTSHVQAATSSAQSRLAGMRKTATGNGLHQATSQDAALARAESLLAQLAAELATLKASKA